MLLVLLLLLFLLLRLLLLLLAGSHLTSDTLRLVRSSCAASARPMVGLGLTPGSCCRMALTWQ